MSLSFARRPPTWYWFVAGLALVWMLFGLYALYLDPAISQASRATMSEAQLRLIDARPGWFIGIYAVAIISGLLGAIGLLLRKGWSVPMFGLSLLAVIVQFGYLYLVLDAIGILGAAEAIPFPLVIFAIGVALLWFATYARRRGWFQR